MHVLIIGFGSIGQRHARILLQQGNVISVVSARTDVPYPTYSSLSAAISSHKFDYILICNETNLHLPTLLLLHQNKVNVPVFVEKPFANLLPVNLPTFSFPLCVGYVLRYHPLISSIASLLIALSIVHIPIVDSIWFIGVLNVITVSPTPRRLMAVVFYLT